MNWTDIKFIPRFDKITNPELLYGGIIDILSKYGVNIVTYNGEIDFGHTNKIYYNFEHLNLITTSPDWFPNFISSTNGLEVWDFDLGNDWYWNRNNIAIKHVPLINGHVNRKFDYSDVSKDIDFLFFGGVSPRRSLIFQKLCELRYKCVYVANLDVLMQENLLSRCKVCVNIGWMYGLGQEQLRIYDCLKRGVCVLSERKSYNYFGDCIAEFDYFDLVDAAIDLIDNHTWLKYATMEYNIPLNPQVHTDDICFPEWVLNLTDKSAKIMNLIPEHVVHFISSIVNKRTDSPYDMKKMRIDIERILTTPFPNKKLIDLERDVFGQRETLMSIGSVNV